MNNWYFVIAWLSSLIAVVLSISELFGKMGVYCCIFLAFVSSICLKFGLDKLEKTREQNKQYYAELKNGIEAINTTFENAFNGNNTVFDTTYNDFGEKIVDEDGYLLSWSYQYDENNNVIYGSDGQPIRICENVVDEHGNKVLADTNLYKDWKPIFQQWRETLEITDENDNANGCIKVNEEVKTFLELLMNKY